MRPDLIYDIPLTDRQIWTFLQVSECTWYRWMRNGIPYMPRLVLRSMATGLPVMTRNSHLWYQWRFTVEGALIGPSNYPISTYDLWVYEFMQRNGMVSRFCDSEGLQRPLNPLMVVNGGRP